MPKAVPIPQPPADPEPAPRPQQTENEVAEAVVGYFREHGTKRTRRQMQVDLGYSAEEIAGAISELRRKGRLR